jgi:transposase
MNLNRKLFFALALDDPDTFWHVVQGAVAELVGIEVGVVSGVMNLESSGVEASDWRPRHDEQYHEA